MYTFVIEIEHLDVCADVYTIEAKDAAEALIIAILRAKDRHESAIKSAIIRSSY